MNRLTWSLVMTSLLSLFAACGSQEKTCAADQKLCSNTCVSLQSDAQNCGACGNVCGAGQGCSAGACVDCSANPAACTAAVAVACFNTNEVRFLGQDLALVGPTLPVGAGPTALAQVAGTFYVANDLSSTLTPFTLAPLHALTAIPVTATTADLSHVTAHGGLLWASSSGVGTLVVIDPALDPAAAVVKEVALAASQGEFVNPQGIDFVGTKAYLALAGPGAVAVLDVTAPTAPKVLKRIDVSKYATGTALAYPSRVLATGARVYVTLNNVMDAAYAQVPGANGKLVLIDPATDTVVGDKALDLGPDCLDASALALAGTTLWVGCGYYDFTTVHGGGLLPISIASGTPQPGTIVKTRSAVDALAVCGGRGYAGATESGTVLGFDPVTGAVSATNDQACPAGQYGSFVPEIACVR